MLELWYCIHYRHQSIFFDDRKKSIKTRLIYGCQNEEKN
jgi:hypothetical protein